LGSLTLGGYDSSRFEPGNLSIPFSPIDARDLTVQVRSITSGDDQLLASPIASFLDSTVPYIYLPMPACTAFETIFGIIWNETSQLYLINDTQHAILDAQNPSITFTLGSLESSTRVNISFPYAAFALEASWPLTPVPTRYFPLRRAANSTQYTLGRAFFQEAHVIADYDRRNFSISQYSWDAGAKQNIVAINPPTLERSDMSTGLSTGTIIGIVIGAVVVVVVLLTLGQWWRLRRRKERDTLRPSNDEVLYQKAELDCDQSKQESWKDIQLRSAAAAPPADFCDSHEIREVQGTDIAVELEGLIPPHELDAFNKLAELDSNSWAARNALRKGI